MCKNITKILKTKLKMLKIDRIPLDKANLLFYFFSFELAADVPVVRRIGVLCWIYLMGNDQMRAKVHSRSSPSYSKNVFSCETADRCRADKKSDQFGGIKSATPLTCQELSAIGGY